jgi:hypothetical protein
MSGYMWIGSIENLHPISSPRVCRACSVLADLLQNSCTSWAKPLPVCNLVGRMWACARLGVHMASPSRRPAKLSPDLSLSLQRRVSTQHRPRQISSGASHGIAENMNGRTRTYACDPVTGKLTPQWTSGNAGQTANLLANLRQTFLPSGFPNSVLPCYPEYHKWAFWEGMFTSTHFVLANQVRS